MAPLTRSKSAGSVKLSQGPQRPPTTFTKKGPQYISSIANGNASIRRSIIECAFRKRYNLESHYLQVECVLYLIALWNTFLLATTGFGKSKVAEMYFETLSKDDKPLVMIMNPLDALGDNQVSEKIKDRFTAISLTQKSFTEASCQDILDGKYQFIYLSPEIFLNSALFTKLYFNPVFQRRLALKVIDEAHLIYCWGLVESGSSKNLSCFKNLQDRGVFRPSYGNLCGRFRATEHAPMVLLSATCRPKAMDAIKKNLRLASHNLIVLRAELVRPEIRLIRVTMKHPLKYARDLHQFFGREQFVPDSDLPPTLIYSGTQNGTWETLSAVHEARGKPELSCNGMSPVARRYHSATGTDDKAERADHFVELLYSTICCTMALGLGQNWKMVRRVLVMGRMEPSAVAQMIGRCGRDGRPGVGVMLVEDKRGGAGAKNDVKSFGDPKTWSDDNRMDALAITPVCLRAAMAVDNTVGHIPISFEDKDYVEEVARQQQMGFAPCLCSNCKPELALDFLNRQHQATSENFTDIILGKITGTISHDHCCPPSYLEKEPDLRRILTCPPKDPIRTQPVFQALVKNLISDVDSLYNHVNPDKNFVIRRRVLFNEVDHAWPIAKNADIISQGVSLRAFLGSEAIDGIFKCILQCISSWQESYLYMISLEDIESIHRTRVTLATKKVVQQLAATNQSEMNIQQPAVQPLPKRTANTLGVNEPVQKSRTRRPVIQTPTPNDTLVYPTVSTNINSEQSHHHKNRPTLTPQYSTPASHIPNIRSQNSQPQQSANAAVQPEPRIITPTDLRTDLLPLRYNPMRPVVSPLANVSIRNLPHPRTIQQHESYLPPSNYIPPISVNTCNQRNHIEIPNSPLTLRTTYSNNFTNISQQGLRMNSCSTIYSNQQQNILPPDLINNHQRTTPIIPALVQQPSLSPFQSTNRDVAHSNPVIYSTPGPPMYTASYNENINTDHQRSTAITTYATLPNTPNPTLPMLQTPGTQHSTTSLISHSAPATTQVSNQSLFYWPGPYDPQSQLHRNT